MGLEMRDHKHIISSIQLDIYVYADGSAEYVASYTSNCRLQWEVVQSMLHYKPQTYARTAINQTNKRVVMALHDQVTVHTP